MRRRFLFTKEKFSELSLKAQHKKCAEFLHDILSGGQASLAHYNELCSWLDLQGLPEKKEKLLDRYHWHLAQSDTSIKESSFFVSTQDRPEASNYLPITIYLENLRSAHNVGAILRTVEAFRIGEVVFSEQMIDASHPKVQKSAMGTQEWVASKKKPLNECPRPLIALETIPTACPYYDFAFPDSFTLAVGNEEYGLSKELLEEANIFIQIPLVGRKNSLNVASAFAIIAAEICRKNHKNILF